MSVRNLSVERIRAVVQELEQASYNHEQWSESLYATLTCRLTPDQRDLASDSYRQCRFGQWLYSSGIEVLEHHPALEELEVEHKRMHQYAASLLRACVNGTPISLEDFQRFKTTRERLRLEIATLQYEFKDALYNLDALTGLPSRVGMLTKLREEQELVKRKVHSCVIAMMDLDNFKAINDIHGHVVGDQVLVAFARYIMSHLRTYDKVYRYGGEELLFCSPDADLTTGRDIFDRLRAELGSLPHEAPGRKLFHVTTSFGLTLLDPDIPVEQSIDRADKALYVAKTTGRNRTVIWDASMNGQTSEP